MQTALCLRALEPIDRAGAVATREDAEFGVGEMRRDLRRNFQERIVGDDASNAPLVIAHKPHVLNEPREIVPSRKMHDTQQDAGQVVVAGEVSVDIGGKRFEIVRRQRRLGSRVRMPEVLSRS